MAAGACWMPALASAGAIDTAFLEQPWPRQRVRETEVGRHAVRWREKANRAEGIFAGLRFTAPLDRQAVWDLSNEYGGLGQATPGVSAVRFVEQSASRQVIEVDAKVLWKTLTLRFEVEKDPPRLVRFALSHSAIGEYRGVSTFEEALDPAGRPATTVELSTWIKPARPVPPGLLLLAERIMFLSAAKEFLKTCEQQRTPQAAAPPR